MTELKVITWNCNGAFRRKFDKLREFDADVSGSIAAQGQYCHEWYATTVK